MYTVLREGVKNVSAVFTYCTILYDTLPVYFTHNKYIVVRILYIIFSFCGLSRVDVPTIQYCLTHVDVLLLHKRFCVERRCQAILFYFIIRYDTIRHLLTLSSTMNEWVYCAEKMYIQYWRRRYATILPGNATDPTTTKWRRGLTRSLTHSLRRLAARRRKRRKKVENLLIKLKYLYINLHAFVYCIICFLFFYLFVCSYFHAPPPPSSCCLFSLSACILLRRGRRLRSGAMSSLYSTVYYSTVQLLPTHVLFYGWCAGTIIIVAAAAAVANNASVLEFFACIDCHQKIGTFFFPDFIRTWNTINIIEVITTIVTNSALFSNHVN